MLFKIFVMQNTVVPIGKIMQDGCVLISLRSSKFGKPCGEGGRMTKVNLLTDNYTPTTFNRHPNSELFCVIYLI